MASSPLYFATCTVYIGKAQIDSDQWPCLHSLLGNNHCYKLFLGQYSKKAALPHRPSVMNTKYAGLTLDTSQSISCESGRND